MFAIANMYNSACSNTINPIRIYPIMMSIILQHYKILKEWTFSFIGFYNSSKDNYDDNIYNYNSNYSKILNQEIDK